MSSLTNDISCLECETTLAQSDKDWQQPTEAKKPKVNNEVL